MVYNSATLSKLFLLLCSVHSALGASVNTLSAATLKLVASNLASHSTDSWVSGVRSEALLETSYPSLSVYRSVYTTLDFSVTSRVPTVTNQLIAAWVKIRPTTATELVVVSGGAAGDPASLGVAWYLAGVSQPKLKTSYLNMVQQELGFLTGTLKRTSDGAMSHRPNTEPVQLWSDFVYMVPPFLAYMGVINNNASLILESYNQCRLYRQYLQDPTTGLWKHVLLGSWTDKGLWGTGNAWAAAGMARVLATLMYSPYAATYSSQINDLTTWTNEITTAAFKQINTKTNLLPNYYSSTSTFDDSASSALMAATVYRLASLGKLNNQSAQITTAELIRKAVYGNVVASTGWLTNVVNPLSWTVQTNQSPEAEAFVMLLQTAWYDWTTGSVRMKQRSRF
ncbi:hypothetical protein T439DRAFT_312181 [Meredithblackwellia eburnea MCA 4105]